MLKELSILRKENQVLRKTTTFSIDQSNMKLDNLLRKKIITLHYTENIYVYSYIQKYLVYKVFGFVVLSSRN